MLQTDTERKSMVLRRANSGFIALFFVLSFATALGVLVFSLSSKSTHMLTLFKSMRDLHIAKDSAIHCLQMLINNKTINQGYKPILSQIEFITNDSYCVYESFVEIPQSDMYVTYSKWMPQAQGPNIFTTSVVSKFIVEVSGVKRVLNGGESSGIYHKLRREYYITDSL